jgi:hypothetical protein
LSWISAALNIIIRRKTRPFLVAIDARARARL